MTKSRRDMILDAAERQFALRGFDGVSMRTVAEAAPVGLGLVTYHFATKDMLFEEVVSRRAHILNAARSEAIAALAGPTLEQLLAAFFLPYVELIEHGDHGWRSYARLHAILTQDSRWTSVATRHFGEVANEMIERLMVVEPSLDRTRAVRGYVLLIGTMVSVFADTGLIDHFSDGAVSSHDIAASMAPMVLFGAGGIRALAADGRAAGRRNDLACAG